MKHNIQTNVNENITKARRSAYSLFGSEFHGNNGLDPFLLYGMELVLPSSKPLEQLELFQKRILKQILSLPMSCPDPAVYILTGILPKEAQIRIKALTFLNNVCHQGEKNHREKACKKTTNREGEI